MVYGRAGPGRNSSRKSVPSPSRSPLPGLRPATRSPSSAPTVRASTGASAPCRPPAACRCRSMPTRSPRRWPMCSTMPACASPSWRTRSRSTSFCRCRSRCRALPRSSMTSRAGSATTITPSCIPLPRCRNKGRAAMAADASVEKAWLERVDAGKGDDLAVILYTSGTTGRPKGVMLTHGNLISAGSNGNAFDHLGESEMVIAYLPLAWVGDHVFSYAQAYTAGYCVCCPESPETVTEDRREIAPTYFFAPPRVFETLLTQIMVRMEDASPTKKRMFDYFIAHARKTGEAILDGRGVGFMDRLKYMLGEFLVYGPLKNRIGMSRMRVGYTAGEAIGPEIFAFYRSLGLNLKQLYGQTEASVYITAQPDGQIRADTVGTPSPGVEIRIADSGEVLYRSDGTFVGYYRNEEATRDTKTEDGWVHTGDAGFFTDDGHLKIIDRAKDVGKLKSGALFAPKYIENKLKFFPNIKEAVVFGNGRDYCAAFLNIDLTAVGSWAERNNVSYASYQELAGHPRVYEMMAEHVDQVNRDLSTEEMMAPSQIRRFLVLHKELDADDGELTRTQKVRRPFIAERYGALIDALYDGSKEVLADTEVTYEDGRKGRIKADVRIVDTPVYGLDEVITAEAAE
ncbi:MAG: AMP-binding protein [Brucellaceae bacterium]|nr:AMP-binding protein [Brucellaceae bacterium]